MSDVGTTDSNLIMIRQLSRLLGGYESIKVLTAWLIASETPVKWRSVEVLRIFVAESSLKDWSMQINNEYKYLENMLVL